MVHVGVDLDKHNSQIAVLTDDGEIVQQRLAALRPGNGRARPPAR